MKIVELMGGLGNQMFQYAFGKALEQECNEKVLYDNFWFNEVKDTTKEGVVREYGLDLFPINPNFATKEQIEPYISKNKLKRMWLKLLGRGGKYVREYKNPQYNGEYLKIKSNAYYKGYFQCPKYFENIAGEIRKDFTFPPIPADDAFNQKWLKRFSECENPVFIHLRRGDYKNLAGWLLPLEYYQKAVAEIKKHVKNPTFFVFGSECDDYIEKEFDIGVPFEVVGEENARNKEDWKDIVLMMNCKHGIIANSTFSWWAAWLSDTDGRTIIAPTPFTVNDDILPDNWIRIKR
jgi:hypothetical protein